MLLDLDANDIRVINLAIDYFIKNNIGNADPITKKNNDRIALDLKHDFIPNDKDLTADQIKILYCAVYSYYLMLKKSPLPFDVNTKTIAFDLSGYLAETLLEMGYSVF